MSEPYYRDDRVTLYHGDCLDVLRTLPDASVHAVVTDPPYNLSFMGKGWDTHDSALGFQRWCELWAAECLRVLKPGGHLLAFGGTRTWHRLACAVEDAGFEVRDSLAWMHGQGFPKSQNVSKALGDKRCQCETVESTHDGDVRGVRDGVPATTEPRRPGEVTDLLAPVQREGARPGVGEVRSASTEDARPLRPEAGTGEPGMEGRGHLQAPEGELCGSALRALPSGVPGDGTGGRLRDGAPSSHGSASGALSAAVGGGESHQPRPAGQPTGELGAVPVERGSQAWGGWPVCGRCGKPSIPDGLGTAAKPAFEPVVVARKPLGAGTVAANVTTHGTGALNIDACRIDYTSDTDKASARPGGKLTSLNGALAGKAQACETTTTAAPTTATSTTSETGSAPSVTSSSSPRTEFRTEQGAGRWPANVILDEDMAGVLDEQSGTLTSGKMKPTHTTAGVSGRASAYGKDAAGGFTTMETYGDSGGASRFFYVAKAPKRERPVVDGVAHPTVKPLALMRWLVRLVTPPGGTVLEPFAGSGTTVEACIVEGFHCIAIEKGDEYLPLILERIARQDRARIEAEVVRKPDAARAIAEQVAGQLDIFGEATA